MKKGDLKRAQILDAAEKLFFEKGYDRTSVQDILDALGMSKGGFYHYFDTKEAVLQSVSERRAEHRFEGLPSLLYGMRRGPVERLNLLLGMANLFEPEDMRFASLMLRLCYVEGDASMRDHHRRILMERLSPHLAGAGRERGGLPHAGEGAGQPRRRHWHAGASERLARRGGGHRRRSVRLRAAVRRLPHDRRLADRRRDDEGMRPCSD